MARRGKGEGSIFKRKDGRWCGFITVGYDEKGNQKKKFFYGKTRQEVADKIRKALNEIEQGFLVDSSDITVAKWFETWLWQYKKQTLKESTFSDYEGIIRNHINPTLGRIKLKDLRPEHLQTLYNEKFESGLSLSKIKHIHTVIHSALKQAVKNGIIPRNVSEATNLPCKDKTKKEIRVLTPEEQQKFLETIENERLKPLFILALTTGMRLGELLALRWENIDFENRIIVVANSLRRIKTFNNERNKTVLAITDVKSEKSHRIIPLPEAAYYELLEHRKRQEEEKKQAGSAYRDMGFVFATRVGTPIDPRNFERTFYRIIKKAGLDINFHALRHTFATRLLEANTHPKVVQELLGHKDITTTMNIYSHVLFEIKKEAIDKMNSIVIRKNKDDTL